MYFASMTLPELVPILSILAAMLAGFFTLQQKQAVEASKEREADRVERRELAGAINNMAEATRESGERVALANERQADEAKERNGHLAELELQSQQMFQALADRNYEAITNITEQHVVNQVVEHETVTNRE